MYIPHHPLGWPLSRAVASGSDLSGDSAESNRPPKMLRMAEVTPMPKMKVPWPHARCSDTSQGNIGNLFLCNERVASRHAVEGCWIVEK